MKRARKSIFFVFISLLLPLAASADVAGNWSGSLQTPEGNVLVTYTFQEKGNTLMGTSIGPDGTPVEIKSGKIDGNNISFLINVDVQGMPMTMTYSGKVRDGNMVLTVVMADMSVPLRLSRDDDA